MLSRAPGDFKTLYVCRPLLNADELTAWAASQGFVTVLQPADMHATLAFSKAVVDWSQLVPQTDELVVGNEGLRNVEKLGDLGATVLRFDSSAMAMRHQQFRDSGASWDHDGYRPHVTLTYHPGVVVINDVLPFAGSLRFGGEVFKEVNIGWADDIVEVPARRYSFRQRHRIKRKALQKLGLESRNAQDKADFMEQCIPQMIVDGEAMDATDAQVICELLWDEEADLFD